MRPPVVVEVGNESTQRLWAAVRGRLPRPVGQVRSPAVERGVAFRIPPAEQQLPELGDIGRTGQNTSHANHGDKIVVLAGLQRSGGVRAAVWLLWRGLGCADKLIQDDMHVQATDPKRIHPGSARLAPFRRRPGNRRLRDENGSALPIDLGITLLDIDGGRHRLVLHAEHGLDHPGNSGRFQGMTNVGLDAGDGNLAAGRDLVGQQFDQRVQLRRIAQLGGRGMRLDVLQFGHFDARPVGPLHGLDLPFLARCPEALSFTIRGNAQAADDRLNRIAIREGPLERFHHQGHVSLAGNQAIRIGIEGTRTGGAHCAGRREEDQRVPFAVGCAPHDGHVDVASLERPCPQQHGL